MNFKIRPAAAADVPEMHRVRTSVRENRLAEITEISETSYLPYISAGSTWVAETDAGLVGFAAVDLSQERIWALFVRPDSEGTGIGQALHRRILRWAEEQSVRKLSLSTEAGSRAVRFYEQAGWTQEGVSPEGEIIFSRMFE